MKCFYQFVGILLKDFGVKKLIFIPYQKLANSLLFHFSGVEPYSYMSDYKCNVVVVVKVGAYIHECVFSMGA